MAVDSRHVVAHRHVAFGIVAAEQRQRAGGAGEEHLAAGE